MVSRDSLKVIEAAKAFPGIVLIQEKEEGTPISRMLSRWENGTRFRYVKFPKDVFVFSEDPDRNQLDSYKNKKRYRIIPHWAFKEDHPYLMGWAIRDLSDSPDVVGINQMVDHLKYLNKHLKTFLDRLDLDLSEEAVKTLIRGHGTEGSVVRMTWEKMNIPYAQGMAIYMLTHISPFNKESRETTQGWIDPFRWVSENFDRFKDLLPAIDYTDPEIESLWQR